MKLTDEAGPDRVREVRRGETVVRVCAPEDIRTMSDAMAADVRAQEQAEKRAASNAGGAQTFATTLDTLKGIRPFVKR
jgi:hypothetical protein